MAKYNFDLIYKRAFMPEFGMMRWAEQSGDRYSTNSCIMGPTEVAACYLAMIGAGEEYFEKARDLYANQRQYLANVETGQVYDSFVWDPATGGVALNEKGEERFNRWASTYNQGTMLGAAVLLYDHYGTPQYAADADKIMEYTVGRMCTADGIISVCQVNDGDLCGFKGILMRYARRYVLDLNRPQYQEWLSKNAFRAYNNRDERGVTTSAWLTKSKREEATNAFSCSCAASAAVNAVLGQVEKNAYSLLPATAFDYQSGIYVHSANDATPTISLKDNTWVVYDNMRFGNTPAHSIAIGVGQYPYTGTATVSVYLDKMAGEPIATIPLSQGNADNYVFADIQPTTGIHHVFLRFAYSTRSRTNAFQLTSLQFSTQSAQELSDGIIGIRTGKLEDGNGDCESHSPSGKEAVGKYFDLQGRRLSRAPQHGLYISEHRKKIYCHH
ncbi:MAG: carbohydrate-binding protein [Prevotella sp.]|nr:carbohydrate-binding protein [Prevotella sp.]